MRISIFAVIVVTVIAACSPSQQRRQMMATTQAELLAQTMAGAYSSAAQAARDSDYYDISLVMYPIWQRDRTAKWLYVEQAVSAGMKKPYRQRVYRIKPTNDGRFESAVFELPDPAAYVHAWEKPALFKTLSPEQLVVREGCTVFLTRNPDGCYVGSTDEKSCKSTMRGASYATSRVSICQDVVVSWDQGWNENDEQVWGAEKAGYVFERKDLPEGW
ncbi:hypothetical protein CEQ90_17750 [Lewinellaceae bacterium SD302]|nr:hypothetical protein CEQ90_17750 [Lewinellaceae bacterium SD302]